MREGALGSSLPGEAAELHLTSAAHLKGPRTNAAQPLPRCIHAPGLHPNPDGLDHIAYSIGPLCILKRKACMSLYVP